MGKLMAVIRREYLERVRSRWFVIATLFGPVFFGALLFLPAILTARDKAKGPEERLAHRDPRRDRHRPGRARLVGAGRRAFGREQQRAPADAVTSAELEAAEEAATDAGHDGLGARLPGARLGHARRPLDALRRAQHHGDARHVGARACGAAAGAAHAHGGRRPGRGHEREPHGREREHADGAAEQARARPTATRWPGSCSAWPWRCCST